MKQVGGEDKVVRVEYDDEVMTKGPEFQARWKKLFGI